MPATEALEAKSYEYAFHILPTVAEGEVPSVFAEIKALITKLGGEIMTEEAPERVDLVYDIVKSIEAKNRRFKSAYFGWIRFTLPVEKIEELTEDLRGVPQILRDLMIKLTKIEEARPFRFHENRKSLKMVEVIDEGEAVIGEVHTEVEKSSEVSEEALTESLEKITKEETAEETKSA